MPLLEWNIALSVNVKCIDLDHQRLVSMVNFLSEVMEAGYDSSAIGDILHGLMFYTGNHFNSEERLMREHGFPDLIEHIEQHAKFVQRTILFKNQQVNGTVDPGEVLEFITSWLINHIKVDDKRLGSFLGSKGVE